MTDQPRLRRAFAGLTSGHAAAADPLAVVAVADRLRRRRTVATSGAALSLAAVLGGVVALRPVSHPGHDVLAQASESPTASLTPTPAPREEVPSASAEPSAPPPSTATATPSSRVPAQPLPPTSPPPSTEPEPTATTTWAPPGLTVTVDTVPAEPTAGGDTTIRVRVVDTDGHFLGGTVDFGDGGSHEFWTPQPMCPVPNPTPDRTPRPSDETQTVRHVYAAEGTYQLRVFVRTGSHCGATPREEKTVTGPVSVGDDGGNGTQAPTAEIADAGEGYDKPRWWDIRMADADGWVSGYTIHFGDDTPPETKTFPRDGCTAGENGYPTSDRVQRIEHKYAEPDTYRVSLTVTSTNCDGGATQSSTLRWTYDGWMPGDTVES